MEHLLLRSKCSIFYNNLKKSYISKASKGTCVALRVKKGLISEWLVFNVAVPFNISFLLF